MTKNIYDFTDTSDLPQELQTRLASSKGAINPVASQIIAVVANAPFTLKLTQIVAAATRSGIEVPSEATVRKYLNDAIKRKEIDKVGREGYGPLSADAIEAQEAQEVADQVAPASLEAGLAVAAEVMTDEAPAEAIEDDPLAGLGLS